MSVTKPVSTLLSRSTSRAISRAAAVAFLALLPVSACDCDPDILLEDTADLIADVCATPQTLDAQGNHIGGIADCLVDFGDSDLTIRTERFVELRNTGSIDLEMTVTLDDDGNGFGFISPPPTRILPGLSVQVGITIRPTLESQITTNLVVISNAANIGDRTDDDKARLVIPITLTGVDKGLPDIEIVPEASCGTTTPLGVDFDFAAVGGIKICSVKVYNRGTRDLFFDSLEFVDGDSDGTVHLEPAESDAVPAIALTGSAPGPEVALPPSNDNAANGAIVDPLVLRLAFSPDVLGRYESVLRFSTSDPNDPTIDLPIVGKGVVGPTCVAEVKSVNGETAPPFSIEPLDDVVITTENSTTANGEIVVESVLWQITQRGGGSTVVPTDPSGIDTGFAFADRRGVDVAGRYEACATVTDSLEVESTNRCCVSFEAIPSQAFLVQLSWANPDGDLDLHVTKRNSAGNYCVDSLGGGRNVDAPFSDTCSSADADADCNYSNCKPNNSAGAPEWDDVAGRTIGDPTLDIDDVTGFGPENTNVDLIEPGSYGFGFDTFSGGIDFLATARLFIFGRLAGEWPVEANSQFVELGSVHFARDPETSQVVMACLEDFTDGSATDDCPDF